MRDRTILIIFIVIALVLYFLYNKNEDSQSYPQNYSIPPEYKGSQGLNYIRNNYASDLAQARSLCVNQFKGNWVDNSNERGCLNMQGFSSYYCYTSAIQNIVNLCNSIGANPICSSNQASCTV